LNEILQYLAMAGPAVAACGGSIGTVRGAGHPECRQVYGVLMWLCCLPNIFFRQVHPPTCD
jgi:hypothetical protein